MKNLEQIKAKIDAISIPESVVRSDKYARGQHIQMVFEDGEISSTKAGDLLWQRTLHLFEFGVPEKAIPVELFPHKMDTHGYVFCDWDKAKELRALILAD